MIPSPPFQGGDAEGRGGCGGRMSPSVSPNPSVIPALAAGISLGPAMTKR